MAASPKEREELASQCTEATAASAARHGMDAASHVALFEAGGNVSDRRFLVETFGMYCLDADQHPDHVPPSTVRLDVKADFNERYFMPYAPGYVISGGDLALFTVSAADGAASVPSDGKEQTKALLSNLNRVLEGLGATFDDVVLVWDRVLELDQHEEAVLMTRSEVGLTRPVAECCIEVVEPLGAAADGTTLMLEYVVVAQVPPSS